VSSTLLGLVSNDKESLEMPSALLFSLFSDDGFTEKPFSSSFLPEHAARKQMMVSARINYNFFMFF